MKLLLLFGPTLLCISSQSNVISEKGGLWRANQVTLSHSQKGSGLNSECRQDLCAQVQFWVPVQVSHFHQTGTQKPAVLDHYSLTSTDIQLLQAISLFQNTFLWRFSSHIHIRTFSSCFPLFLLFPFFRRGSASHFALVATSVKFLFFLLFQGTTVGGKTSDVNERESLQSHASFMVCHVTWRPVAPSSDAAYFSSVIGCRWACRYITWPWRHFVTWLTPFCDVIAFPECWRSFPMLKRSARAGTSCPFTWSSLILSDSVSSSAKWRMASASSGSCHVVVFSGGGNRGSLTAWGEEKTQFVRNRTSLFHFFLSSCKLRVCQSLVAASWFVGNGPPPSLMANWPTHFPAP